MNDINNDIDKFDAYLNGMMSENEKAAFDALLETDERLRQEFVLHKELVANMQHAGNNSDREFEAALKHISDEEMKRIIERQPKEKQDSVRTRVVPLRRVYSWVAVAAAVVMIAGAGGYLYHEQQTRNKLCDAIFSVGFHPDMSVTRSGNEAEVESYSEAINKLQNGETDKAISILEKLFAEANAEMKIEYGTSLAYAFVRAHHPEKAWETINKVQSIGQQLYGETPPEVESLIHAMNEQKIK